MFFLSRAVPFFLLLSVCLFASDVRWFGDFETAHKQAINKNKKIMVLLLKDTKPTCQKILNKLFRNRSYVDEINKNYISVIAVKGQKQSYPIEMLYTTVYPTIFFLDATEIFLCEPLMGNITPDGFKNHLKRCR